MSRLWTIGNKLLLLLYLVYTLYFGQQEEPSGLLLLSFLLYAALNLCVHLLRQPRLQQAAIATVILFLLAVSWLEAPPFLLLLPLSAYELASFRARRAAPLLAASLLPLAALGGGLGAAYALVWSLSWFNYATLSRLHRRSLRQEDELDRLRGELRRLSARIGEGQELQRIAEYAGQLEERSRIAQEIHDGVGHAMTGALIQMEAAKRLLGEDPQRAGGLLQNAIGISKGAIEDIRRTLHRMKPPPEQLGMSRLREAVDAFRASSGMQASVTHAGDLERIGALHWRIVQGNVTEALTNAARYSGASAVHVEVRVLGRYVQAVVSDNGRGQARIVKGLGIAGMEERAASAGGTVVADGSDGFRVTTLLPCPEAQR